MTLDVGCVPEESTVQPVTMSECFCLKWMDFYDILVYMYIILIIAHSKYTEQVVGHKNCNLLDHNNFI